MADCTFTKIEFPSCCKRRVEADFAGGEISSNGGALLLSLAGRRVGLLSGLGRRLADRRQAGKVKHGLTGLLRQRVFALALGDEDVNDHEVLRDDLVLQTACGGDRRLASPSTVGRLERAADRSWAWAAHETLVESFIASTEDAPEELVLDFDCTDDAVHGCQEGRFFHGYWECQKICARAVLSDIDEPFAPVRPLYRTAPEGDRGSRGPSCRGHTWR